MNLFLHSPQSPWFRMHMDDVKDVDGVTYVEYLKNEQAGHDFNLQFEKRFCFFGRGTWSFEIPRN